ncbi:hypothetical protein SteCoe_2761 [Stentor coeruleus]|uniref:Uncharacterized protein n=1 Tax=Stentor coeruleus TaxID=5963 RepID=A0A1R2CYP0_9CILI|nr:hypothetical protein SteCoe_2761 [Stentor coeruleus]
MKSFENIDNFYLGESPQHNNNDHHLQNLKNLETQRQNLKKDQNLIKKKSEELDFRIDKFNKTQNTFSLTMKKKQDILKKRESELIKHEQEIQKVYQSLEQEKEKWMKILENQLKEIENKELGLESQHEELATELEKCQILSESLHRIQSEIRFKSQSINKREKAIKLAEDRLAMYFEDYTSLYQRQILYEDFLKSKELELENVVELIEVRNYDIKITSDMFENINKNLIEKMKKIDNETDYLNKCMMDIDKQKIMYKKKFEKLEDLENDLEKRMKKIQELENSFIYKFKTIESIGMRGIKMISSTTEEDEDVIVTGFNVLTSRSNDSNL